MTTNVDIQNAARAFVRTPFRHQGRISGVGIDCVGLVLSIGEDFGLVDRLGIPFRRDDYPNYAAQPSDRFVFDELRRRAIARPIGSGIVGGDILAIRIPELPCHAAVAIDRAGHPYMIHAYDSGPRQCVEHIFSLAWRHRVVGVFRFPGVTY
jgi:hypothetical protein